MNYEWDESKRKANISKHGVDFEIAENFEWDAALETIDDRHDYREDRWTALGYIEDILYVLIYTYRTEIIRIISLRKANNRERGYYEKQIW